MDGKLKKFKGAFFLAMVIIIWVASAVLIQMIFNSASTQFNKPLFLTYFSTSFFTLYLVPIFFEYCYLKRKQRKEADHKTDSEEELLIE